MIARSGFIKERDSGALDRASRASRSARRSCWNGVRSDPKSLDRLGDEARVLVRLGQLFVAQSIFLHLAVEGRPADSQASSDLRHLSAIVLQREADRLGLQVLELAHVAALSKQSQHVGVADLDAHDLALARGS